MSDQILKPLNRLIRSLIDGVSAFESAAQDAHSYLAYAEYEHDVVRRKAVINSLRALVVRMGGRAPTTGTWTGALKRVIGHLLRTRSSGDLLIGRLLEYEERHLITTVEKLATSHGLPGEIRSELQTVLRSLRDELFEMEIVDFRIETRPNGP